MYQSKYTFLKVLGYILNYMVFIQQIYYYSGYITATNITHKKNRAIHWCKRYLLEYNCDIEPKYEKSYKTLPEKRTIDQL